MLYVWRRQAILEIASAIRDSTRHEAEIPFLYRCMPCSVSFRAPSPLSGRYDRAHRSAALTMTLMKFLYADLRSSWDRYPCEDLPQDSQLSTTINVLGTVPDYSYRLYDAFAHRSWHRAHLRLMIEIVCSCFVMERVSLNNTGIAPWTRWSERGLDCHRSEVQMIAPTLRPLTWTSNVDRRFMRRGGARQHETRKAQVVSTTPSGVVN